MRNKMQKNEKSSSGRVAHGLWLIALCVFLLAGCGGGGGSESGGASTPTTPGGTTTTTSVSIVSDPAGMSVYLNDVLQGTTPFFSETVSPGAYTLKLVPLAGAEILAPTKVDTFVVSAGASNYYSYTPDTSSASQPAIDWGKR